MNNKERLPKLVNVYQAETQLKKRQLPLVVDENLTLVMDINGSGTVCDNPLVRGREFDEFKCKYETLSKSELRSALQITKADLMNVLNHSVPCVGCRRSVERLYYQLFKYEYPTLQPLMVQSDGSIVIRAGMEKNRTESQVLCSIFHNHSDRLAKLIENQPKRNKKSQRCLLHSLDSQRSRPLTPVWKDVWNSLFSGSKKEICIIEAHTLHSTLETYLRKHRFCGECRTKVLKAYSLLMEDPEPHKEKGYVPSLYSGIKRCIPEKHIHLPTKSDYITKLISRAEPELLGSRRERHAKTLEIAQEEVLTCLGICMYERLHRLYMRIREEECTCQVFAAVAVDTLSRSFETAVERKQGVSQLEMFFAELARADKQKQIRKEQKKIKRKRKKGSISSISGIIKPIEQEGKENCKVYEEEDDDKDDLDKSCSCSKNKTDDSYSSDELITSLKENTLNCVDDIGSDSDCSKQDKSRCGINDLWLSDCKCESDIKRNKKNFYKLNVYLPSVNFKKENGSSSDCGYSSEHNNGCCETGSIISSISSSPEGSELACSDSCYQNEIDYFSHGRYGHHQSLQEMLEGSISDDDENWRLTPEEVWEFENNHQHLKKKRQELRETLKQKFIDFCVYGPLQVPGFNLLQTKYASN